MRFGSAFERVEPERGRRGLPLFDSLWEFAPGNAGERIHQTGKPALRFAIRTESVGCHGLPKKSGSARFLQHPHARIDPAHLFFKGGKCGIERLLEGRENLRQPRVGRVQRCNLPRLRFETGYFSHQYGKIGVPGFIRKDGKDVGVIGKRKARAFARDRFAFDPCPGKFLRTWQRYGVSRRADGKRLFLFSQLISKRERIREELLLPVGIRHLLHELVRARGKELPHGFMGLLPGFKILSPAVERNKVRGIPVCVRSRGRGFILCGSVDESTPGSFRSFAGAFIGSFSRKLFRQFLKPAAEGCAEDARPTAR